MNVTHRINVFVQWFCFGAWLVSHFVLLLLVIGMIHAGVLLEGIPMVLLLSAFWSAVFYFLLMQMPKVVLSENGIMTQILFRKKFFSWNEIQQAGILWRMGKGMWYNQIVLVPTNGSRRGYKDKTFLLRNLGKVICLLKTEEARGYIIRHYGPLDFDLSDGQPEQSIVAD